MKIAFATAQRLTGSTNVGRVLPLAKELGKQGHEVHILALQTTPTPEGGHTHYIGTEPFQRTNDGKKRMRGFPLIFNMLATALRTTTTLLKLRPNIIIISKPLPSNVMGVRIYGILNTRPAGRGSPHGAAHYKLILDADDFELTANQLTSIYQRAAIHWSERTAARLARTIVTASHFLADHFKQLTQNAKPVTVVPTGIEQLKITNGTTPNNKHTQLLYIGSISLGSGHRVDLLPEILSTLVTKQPNIHLTLAGDGDDIEKLKQEFATRNLTQYVTWHGRFTLPAHRSLPSAMSSGSNGGVGGSDLLKLLTPNTIILDPVDGSIANRAKSSFRVMLAGTLGLPVVTSNIGIRPDLIPSKFHKRFFADPGSAESYAAKILQLFNSPLPNSERTTLQSHARQFSWEKLGAKYNQIITAL